MTAPLTIADLKALARRRVPKMFFEYADSGSWTEGTYGPTRRTLRQSNSASACWST